MISLKHNQITGDRVKYNYNELIGVIWKFYKNIFTNQMRVIGEQVSH